MRVPPFSTPKMAAGYVLTDTCDVCAATLDMHSKMALDGLQSISNLPVSLDEECNFASCFFGVVAYENSRGIIYCVCDWSGWLLFHSK